MRRNCLLAAFKLQDGLLNINAGQTVPSEYYKVVLQHSCRLNLSHPVSKSATRLGWGLKKSKISV